MMQYQSILERSTLATAALAAGLGGADAVSACPVVARRLAVAISSRFGTVVSPVGAPPRRPRVTISRYAAISDTTCTPAALSLHLEHVVGHRRQASRSTVDSTFLPGGACGILAGLVGLIGGGAAATLAAGLGGADAIRACPARSPDEQQP